MGKPAGKRRSGPGPRRRDDKSERRRGRLGESRLAQEEKRPPGLKRTAMQASGRGEVEATRIAPDLEEYRRKGFHPRRLLGDPERILELARPGEKGLFRTDAEARLKTRKIGKARFAEDIRRADPEERPCSFLQQQASQGQGETGYRSGVACLSAMKFDEAGARPPAAERRIESIRSRPQKGWPLSGRHAVATHEDAVFVCRSTSGRIERVGEDALDPGDFPAQGENSLPRHGAFNHDDIDLGYVFMLCSYGFQRPIRESSGFIRRKEEFIPLPFALSDPSGFLKELFTFR
jgi:hypothetical protein